MVQVVNSSTVKLGPNLSITSYLDGGKLVADTWVRGYVDLSEFPAISYDGMYFADVSGTSQPVMYLDDIVAVPKNISGTSGTTGTTSGTTSKTTTSGTSTTSGSTSGTTGSTTTAKVTTGTTSGTSGSSTTTTSGTSTSEVTSGTTTDVATTGEITTTTTGNTTDVDSTTTTSELVSSANIVACHSVILVLIFAVLIQL